MGRFLFCSVFRMLKRRYYYYKVHCISKLELFAAYFLYMRHYSISIFRILFRETAAVSGMEVNEEKICLLHEEEYDETIEKSPVDDNENSEFVADKGLNSQPLSHGKKYHLFVIHQSDDEDVAKDIVLDIEKRFKIKCMLSMRDFEPGIGIAENCHLKMNESEKVLVLISPGFFDSYWSNLELKHAQMFSSEHKREDLIIPVILKPMQETMPADIRYHTYIEASKEPDLAKRIYDAFLFDAKGIQHVFNFTKRRVSGCQPRQLPPTSIV